MITEYINFPIFQSRSRRHLSAIPIKQFSVNYVRELKNFTRMVYRSAMDEQAVWEGTSRFLTFNGSVFTIFKICASR